MIITPTDLTTLTFAPVQNTLVTERVFNVVNTVIGVDENHIVLVHIDKQENDTDGDGTVDALDGKFCLSLINSDGTEVQLNSKPIKISQVHSVNVTAINDGSVDLVDWISQISVDLIPIVINKKATLSSWGAI